MADLKSRIQFKHDTAANWAKATNFIPLIGEIIIYDTDGDTPVRFKIGDGINYVNALPFASKEEALLYTAQNLTEEQKSQARENVGAISDEEMQNYVDSKTIYIPILYEDDAYSLGEGWTYEAIKAELEQNHDVILVDLHKNNQMHIYRCAYVGDDDITFYKPYSDLHERILILPDNTVVYSQEEDRVIIRVVNSTSNYKLLDDWTYDKIVNCINNNTKEVVISMTYTNGATYLYRCVGLIKYNNYDYVVPEFISFYNHYTVRRLIVHPESIYPDGNVMYSLQTLVSNSRTINGHALSSNIVLTAEDIGVEEGATNNTITIKTWTAADVEGGN